MKHNFEDIYFSLEKSAKVFMVKLKMIYSRRKAHIHRREIVRKNAKAIIDRKIKRVIKEYSRQRFGTSAYWPYLALYTEIRGQFIKGWLPYDYYRYVLLPRINPPECCAISEQKTFDYRLFGDFAIKPLFVFISGIYFDADLKVVELDQLKLFFSYYNDIIVVKQDNGCQGKQVSFIHSSLFNPKQLSASLNYTIQPNVRQYEVLEELHPSSVNTFRVVTWLCSDGSVKPKFAILRFGIDGIKVDNLASGGQFIYFDHSGKPSDYAYDLKGFNKGDRHKNTGILFSTLKIPMFFEILERCIKAHKKYSYTRLIAWDVCIDTSGEPKLLEWNTGNPTFLEIEAAFGPFWPDNDEL